jgi:acyl dehydratase
MNALPAAALATADELVTESAPVTTMQLVRYAGASDDYNRIHYDLPYAEGAGLGGIIAHGMLTMGFMARALTDGIGPGGRVKTIAARFVAPVRPGDVVRLECRVRERQAAGTGCQIDCELVALVGAKTVARGEATAIIPA